MGNQYCSGRREKVTEAKNMSKFLLKKYTAEAKFMWQDAKEQVREKYEEAKFNYKVKKQAEQDIITPKRK
jgi:hypothetical protein